MDKTGQGTDQPLATATEDKHGVALQLLLRREGVAETKDALVAGNEVDDGNGASFVSGCRQQGGDLLLCHAGPHSPAEARQNPAPKPLYTTTPEAGNPAAWEAMHEALAHRLALPGEVPPLRFPLLGVQADELGSAPAGSSLPRRSTAVPPDCYNRPWGLKAFPLRRS